MPQLLLLASLFASVSRRWLVWLGLLAGFAPAPERAQPPRYRTTLITFVSAGTTLTGTLVLPTRPPVAAVVLVHGSGQEPRQLGLAGS